MRSWPCSSRRREHRSRSSELRVALALLSLVRDAEAAGHAPTPTRPANAAKLAAIGPARSLIGTEIGAAYAVRGLMAWATLFGHVSLELFGHLSQGVVDYDAHFALVVEQLADDLGL